MTLHYFLLFTINAVNTSVDAGNNDLVKTIKYGQQCKMSFNPNPIKQTQEVIFTTKISKEDHPPLVFQQQQCIRS